MRKLFILTILLGLCAYNKVTVVEQHAEPLFTLNDITYARIHVIRLRCRQPTGVSDTSQDEQPRMVDYRWREILYC